VIDGVIVHPLRQFPDERGRVMHMLRASDPHFRGFGEIYFSVVYPGVVKGWHLHKRMVLNYAVPHGRIKFVLFDPRPDSATRGRLQELFLGPDHYCLVQVPAGVWNGFKGIGTEPALVANCATLEHDAEEIVRMDPHHNDVIAYDWALQHG
jgi:dTDP-4-dehydrorhamnose 3,5-epimerase